VHAIPRSMRCAEAEDAAGREGAPGGDVVLSQTVEAETDERGWHRALTTRVWRGTTTALNEREAIGVNRRARMRKVALRGLRAKTLVHGRTGDWPWAKPLVCGHPSNRVAGRRRRTVGVPRLGTTMTIAAPPLLGDDDRTRDRAPPNTRRGMRG
jgi:hypothetical protein